MFVCLSIYVVMYLCIHVSMCLFIYSFALFRGEFLFLGSAEAAPDRIGAQSGDLAVSIN